LFQGPASAATVLAVVSAAMSNPAPTEAQARPSDGTRLLADYSPHEHRPLGSYALMTAIFGATFVGSLAAAERSGRRLPESISTRDVVLVGLATHKISRLISKDKITSFVRAPFVRYQEPAGRGEVSEEVRGTGLRMSLGELLNCPYCLGQWIVGALAVGLVAAPRPTRLVAAMYSAETVADFLQLAYAAAEERA
jgi:hypothetical protein